jgi:hypothetical protein
MSTLAIEAETLQQHLAKKFGHALQVWDAAFDENKSNFLMSGEEKFGFHIIDKSVIHLLVDVIEEYLWVAYFGVRVLS